MSDWKTKTLGEVTSYIAKGIPPKYVEEATAETICVLNQKCNRNFRISYDDSRLHNNAAKKVPDVKMLKPGDVLINSTGTGTAGRVAQIWNIEAPTTIDGHMILMRPTEEIEPLYYGYAVKAFQTAIESYAEGSTGQTEINKTRLQNETLITYPVDKGEQSKIARILAALDEKILLNEEVNKNLEEQVRTLTMQWLIEHTGEYKYVPLSEIASVNSDTYSLKEAWPFVNYLDTSSITDGVIGEVQLIHPTTEKLPSRARRIISANDIVYSTVRPNQHHYGIIHEPLENMLASTGFAVIRSRESCICNELIYLCLTDNSFIEKMQQLAEQSTSTFPSIKPTDLGGCNIPYPVDDNLTETLKTVYSIIAEHQKENLSLVVLRDALLPKLMSGEIDVSDIDL